MRIVESLLRAPTWNKQDHLGAIKHETMVKDFLSARDDLGSTALHYAFYKHNFDLVDFVHSFLETANPTSTILPSFESLMCHCKDAAGQSAFSTLFWQIGRIKYSKGASF